MITYRVVFVVYLAALYFNRTRQRLIRKADMPGAAARGGGERIAPCALDLDCTVDDRAAYCSYAAQGAGVLTAAPRQCACHQQRQRYLAKTGFNYILPGETQDYLRDTREKVATISSRTPR